MTIWIDDSTKLRVNINAPYKGYSRLETAEQRAAANVVEIAEPTPPGDYSDDIYYRTESQEAPYILYTRKSDEQIAKVVARKAKQAAKEAATGDVEADVVCKYLREHTPLETYQYVQTNVTDLASAKEIIGKLAAAVGVLLR
jgi:hypothetical protein